MRIKNILVALFISTILVACGGNDYSPKPKAYLRIDLPEEHYWLVDTLRLPSDTTIIVNGDTLSFGKQAKSHKTFPFIFEANECVKLAEKDAPKGEVWLDLNYPQWDGVVFLTYKHLRSSGDLRGQIDTSSRMLEKHYPFASGIDEQVFESDDHTVHAVKWRLKGKNVASTYQFYATDSVRHFLRGAVFINHAPNNDSIAPVLDYIHHDLDRLIETLRWR